MKVRAVLILAAGMLLLALTSAAWAAVTTLTVDFIETGDTVNAYVNGVLTASGVETAQVTVPFAAATPGFSFYSDMLESPGGPLSDRVLVELLATTARITFVSDPLTLDVTGAIPFFAGATALVEDGTLQLLFQMTSLGGANATNMFVSGQSELTEVPEPGTLLLAGSCLIGLYALRKKFWGSSIVTHS